MLLAVEGGGFFSSSASGYSKGLTLLLLGHKNEEKPMRVAPWTQYELNQETDPHPQLAPGKNRLVRGCASFVCFGRAAGGHEGPSPTKDGLTQNQEVLPTRPIDLDENKDPTHLVDIVAHDDDDDDDGSLRKIDNSFKSSLKKSVNTVGGGNGNKHVSSCETDSDVACQMGRRKVRWADVIGGELFEIREFEMSEDGSDDEFDHVNGKTCACRIM
ncbi:hypothetical protein OROGR_021527 [Orobanche gracilis]